MADGKVIIETALDASGVTQGIELIKSALATIGIGALVKDIVDTGANFEETMSKVGALSGATEDQLASLTDAAKEMGRTSVFSATESATAMTYMGMAGWNAEQMINGLPGVMNLAAASGEDLGTVSDIVTDALTAFGLSAEDSSHFADVLATASSSANTNVGMLGESFKYVAPLAGSLGYSVEDTTTALALMANAGIKGGQAGTALRAAFTRMVKPTKQSGAAMDALGISLTDSEGNMLSMAGVMDELRDTMGNLSESEQAEYAALLFGQEAMSGMLAIINASDEDYQSLQDTIAGASDAYDGLGSATGMAEQMIDNFNGQMTLMGSALEGMKLAIWENLQEPLTNLASIATDAITALTDAFKEGGTGALLDAASNMMLSFLDGITAQIPGIVSKGAEIVSYLMNAVTQNGPKFISTAATLISTWITSLAAQLPNLIPQGLQMVLTLVNSVIQNIPKLVSAGISLVKGLVEGIINSIPLLIQQAPKMINDFWDMFDQQLGTIVSAGASLIVKLVKGIISNIPLVVANASEIVKAIFNTIMHLDLLNAGKKLFTNLANGLKSMGPTIKTTASNVGKNALNAIKSINWLQLGKNIIKGIVNGIKGLGTSFTTGIKTVGVKGFTALKNINWLSLGKSVLTMVINGIKAMGSLLASGLKSLGSSALTAFKSINWLSLGTNVVKGICSGVSGAASSLVNSMKGLASKALSSAKSALGIKSPSRVMRDQVGKFIPMGAAVGVDANAYMLSDSITNMADDAVEKAAGMADELSEAMIPSSVDLGAYYSDLMGMLDSVDAEMPAVKTAKMGVVIDTVTKAQEMATAFKNELKDTFSDIKNDVKSGVLEGMNNVSFNIDGRKAGKLMSDPLGIPETA